MGLTEKRLTSPLCLILLSAMIREADLAFRHSYHRLLRVQVFSSVVLQLLSLYNSFVRKRNHTTYGDEFSFDHQMALTLDLKTALQICIS